MATVFTKIINGDISHGRIYEDDQTLAFLDHNPATTGHTLVIPKAEIDHLDDCPPEVYDAVFRTVRRVSRHLRKVLGAKRIAIVVHGLEIPHAHVHVVPLYTGHELHLASRDKQPITNEALEALATQLRITD